MNGGKLIAYFQSIDEKVNTIESGGHIKIVFADPPENATDVEVKIIEAVEVGQHLEHQAERKLLTFKGEITNKEFIVGTLTYHYEPPKDSKRSPTIWIETGQHPSYDVKITLPDDREENGRFDLRLDIKGKIDGKDKIRKGLALLHVYYPMDVMIIPSADDIYDTEHHALRVIRRWANQWKNYAPATRAIVGMAVDKAPMNSPVQPSDYVDFHRAFREAARIAHGGIIALAVGHGGGGADGGIGWTNLVPEDRADNDVVGRLSIDQNALAMGLVKDIMTTPSEGEQVKLNALSQLGDILDTTYPSVSELRFQTCRVGLNPMFLGMVADRIRIPVRGHRDFIDYSPAEKTYCHYESDTVGYEIDENLHEWLEKELSDPIIPYMPPPERQPPRRFDGK